MKIFSSLPQIPGKYRWDGDVLRVCEYHLVVYKNFLCKYAKQTTMNVSSINICYQHAVTALYARNNNTKKWSYKKKKIERRKEEILKRKSMFSTMKMMRLFLFKLPRDYQIQKKCERKNEMNSGISTPLALHYQDTNFH